MITRINGVLNRLSEESARIEAGPFEYEVFVPEFVRRQIQGEVGKTVSLRTIEYLEGNPQGSRLTPRMIGFLSEVEVEFFDQVCSVDGMGVKKTLRAMVRPVREIAEAIEEQNVKELSLLPGIGPAMAERIVAKLRRKMVKFALLIAKEFPDQPAEDRSILSDAFEALISLGYDAPTARTRLDAVTQDGKKKFKSVDQIIFAIYEEGRG
ncbi:MAG: Holliday junction DNA helicase RuvA [Planctomycetaceae bacterium]|nr:Holliday junction DNA helicase RuvA [Planctomycetaceae bacterium]